MMSREKVLFLLLLALAVGAVSLPGVYAQAVYGTLTGTVKDETGGVVPGAELTIEDVAKGTSWRVVTDDSGRFRKERLVPGGNYRVTVSMPGFMSLVRENIAVGVDAVVDLNIVLTVGEITQQVTVTGVTPLLKTEKTDVSVAFGEREVVELPIFERNFTRFLLLTPGTSTLAWQHAASENPQGSRQIMVNGQHFSGTGFELDGTSNRDPILGIIVINPTLEGVTEAKITSQNYDAEFGQATAGVVTAQTKSGTNEIHGSAFLFRRNDELQARNPFTQSRPLRGTTDKFIPDTLWNQFGGSVGGPIVRDKAFFFTDYQGTRRKNGGSVLTTVPLAQAREIVNTPFGRGIDLSAYTAATGNRIYNPFSGDPNDPRTRTVLPGSVIPENLVSPQALSLMKLLPLPNGPGIDNNFSTGGIEAFDDDAFNVRGDWAYSEKMHIFGRYSFAEFERSGPGAFGEVVGGPNFEGPDFAGSSRVRNQSIAGGFDWTLNPTLLTDFRFGFFRYQVNVLPGGVGTTPAQDVGIPNLNRVPGVQQDPIFTSGMPAFFIDGSGGFRFGWALGINRCNCPLDQSEQQWQWVNNWISTHGSHTLKFGADIRYAQNRRIPSDAHRSGQLSFSPDRTRGPDGGLGVATYLMGEVSSLSRFVSPSTDAEERQKRWFFYGQDTWKINQQLTLNYGLRWEIYFPESVTEVGRGGWFDVATGEMRVGGVGGIGLDGDVKNSLKNLAPRLGITYQVKDNAVLRLGYGRSFDLGVFGSTFGHAVTQNLPVMALQNLTTDSFKSVFNLSKGPPTPLFPQPGPNGRFKLPDGVSTRVRPDKMRLATLDAWNVTFQQELPGNLAWEIGYVANKGSHVFAGDGPGYNFNQPIMDSNPAAPGKFSPVNSRKPWFAGPIQGFGKPFGLSPGFSYFGNDASNNYHSLQTRLERRFSRGWSILGHYTLARARQHGSNYYIWDPAIDYGPPDWHRQQVFVLNGLYEVPIGRGRPIGNNLSRAADAAIGGWQVNFVANWSSGLPFTPTHRNCGLLRDTGPCRPNRVGKPESGGDRNRWFTVGSGAGTPWEIPRPGTFGSEERNQLIGPQFFNTDFSIFKNFQLAEEVRLQFRAEIFNVFNRVNLGNPNSCVDCSPQTDGRIFGIAPQSIMRQVQWALRLEF